MTSAKKNRIKDLNIIEWTNIQKDTWHVERSHLTPVQDGSSAFLMVYSALCSEG